MLSPKKETPTKRQRSASRSPSPSESSTNSPRKKKSATGEELTQRSQRNIPAFLNKLYSMVDDSSTNDLIKWSDDGNSFIVEQQKAFSKTVLPRFYKHNTFSSFVRQLNMYDFHKVPHIQQGVLVADSEHEPWEFSHPNFQRNRHDLLYLVVRKRIRNNNDSQQQQKQRYAPPAPALPLQHAQQTLLQQQHTSLLYPQSTSPGTGLDSSAIASTRLNSLNSSTSTQLEHVRLGSLVKDISTIRDHQHAISSDLQHLHNDNEILWRETLMAREKHQRHQQVIERILLFLTTVFTNDATKHSPSTLAGKQNEFLSGGSHTTGSSNSLVDAPNKLIEEAVKLAGISTTALQEKLLDQNVEAVQQPNMHSQVLGQQAQQQTPTNIQGPALTATQQSLHQQSTDNIQSSQDKGKSGMRGGVSGMEPSFLFRALNDLYSIRDTSFPSHLPGMKSSATDPSLFNRAASLPTSIGLSSQMASTGYPSFQQQPQNTMGLAGTTGNGNGGLPANSIGDSIHGPGNLMATAISKMDTPTITSVSGTTTPTVHHGNVFGDFSPFNELSSIAGDQSNADCGDITRITGLAQSIHTATRSAEAISQDIDDLQISIESLAATVGLDANGMEGFDGYMDEFTDSYSNMISLATRNDKMELFNLAANSNYSSDQNTQQKEEGDNSSFMNSTMQPSSS